MDLGSGDRARLRGIEAGLAATDPALAKAFRSLGAPSAPPGWSTVPAWAVVVFLAAFVTWMVTPILGVPVGLVGTVWLVVERMSRRDERRRAHRVG